MGLLEHARHDETEEGVLPVWDFAAELMARKDARAEHTRVCKVCDRVVPHLHARCAPDRLDHVYLYMHMWMHMYMDLYMHLHMHMYIFMQGARQVDSTTCARLYTYRRDIYIYIHVCRREARHIQVNIHIHIHIRIQVHVYRREARPVALHQPSAVLVASECGKHLSEWVGE